MCDCYSYNKATGDVKEEILISPVDGKQVCIDACISNVIQQLWDKGLWTEGSCCGHGKQKPNILIPSGQAIPPYKLVISRIDNRDWTFSQWQRIDNL